MKHVIAGLTTIFLLAGIQACGNSDEGLTSAELALRTTDISSDLARQVTTAAQFLEQVESLTAAGNGLEILQGMFGSDDEFDVEPPEPEKDVKDEEDGIDPEEAAAEVKDFLDTYVFIPAQLESEEPDLAVYLLQGAVLCSEDFMGPGRYCDPWDCMGNPVCESEQEQWIADCEADWARERARCEADVDALEIRVRVATEGDGVVIRLQIGPERTSLVVLALQPDQAALHFDLTEVGAALVPSPSVLDEEPLNLPEILEGRFSFVLTQNAENDFTLNLDVSQAIQVRMDIPEVGTVEANMGTSEALLNIHLDGTANALDVSVDLGNSDVSIPFGSLFEAGGDGALVVELAGLEGQVALSESENHLTITGLGLGDGQSRIRHDDVVLASLDVNANAGRHFDLTVRDDGGFALVDFLPGLAVDLYLNLGHLDTYLDPEEEPAPAALRDQTYSLELSAASGPASIKPLEGIDGEGAIQVVTGQLSLWSSATAEVLDVATGQCLMPTAECAEDAPSIIQCLTATTCP